MIQLKWEKPDTGGWYPFETMDLSPVKTQGVYIIWESAHAGSPGTVIYIGQGDVKNRILYHRQNIAIQAYNRFGDLYVTWAAVRASQMDGIERYLADTFHPRVGTIYPKTIPLAANAPW